MSKAKYSRELVSRVAALAPEAIIEAARIVLLDADRFIAVAEEASKNIVFLRLNREVGRLIERNRTAQGRAYEKNSERISEIFDEMDLLHPNPERPLQPLSKKYQRLAKQNARLAEMKGTRS